MPETNNTKKAVTTENLAALAGVLATKGEVSKQIEDAQLGGLEFATDEEVLALFQEDGAEGPAE